MLYTLHYKTIAGDVQIIFDGAGGANFNTDYINLEDMGAIKESIDGSPEFGIMMFENVNFTFIDNCSFFYYLFSASEDVNVIIKLNNLEIFRGIVDLSLENIEWEIYARDSSYNKKYRCRFTVVSPIIKLGNIKTEEVVESIPGDWNYLFIRWLLVQCLAIGIVESGRTEYDYYLPFPASTYQDIKYRHSGSSGFFYFIDLMLRKMPDGLFDKNSENYIGKTCNTALDLLKYLSNSFGFIPLIKWNPTQSRHFLYLNHRRQRSNTVFNIDNTYVISESHLFSSLHPKNIKVELKRNFIGSGWVAYRYNGQIYTTKPTEELEFDYDQKVSFEYGVPEYARLYIFQVPNREVVQAFYFDYSINDWAYYACINHSTTLLYYYAKQFIPMKKSNKIKYKGILNLNCLDPVIYDGVKYYINSVEKNLLENITNLELVEY